MEQTVASIKFIFSEVLNKEIPVVLTEEVEEILNSVQNLRHKIILMIVNSADLRLNELLFFTGTGYRF